MAAGRASPASRRRAAIGQRLFGLVAPVCGALIRPRIAATPLLLASLSLPGLRGPAPGLSAHRVDPGQRAGRPVVVPRGPRPRLACSLSSALSRSVDRSPLRLAVGIVAPRSSRLSPAPVDLACRARPLSRYRRALARRSLPAPSLTGLAIAVGLPLFLSRCSLAARLSHHPPLPQLSRSPASSGGPPVITNARSVTRVSAPALPRPWPVSAA